MKFTGRHVFEKDLKELFYSPLDYIDIVATNSDVIKKGLLSYYNDFEDAIQIIAARAVPGLDFIVTRNLKDFKDAGITVLPPGELIGYL